MTPIDLQDLSCFSAQSILFICERSPDQTGLLARQNPFIKTKVIVLPDKASDANVALVKSISKLRGRFDQILLAHPLEVFPDLAAYLRVLRKLAADDSSLVINSTNINHWVNHRRLFQGEDIAAGVSLTKITRALECSGWHLLKVKPIPIREEGPNKEQFDQLESLSKSFGKDSVRGELELNTERWIVWAHANQKSALLHVVGLGLPKKAGVTEARIDHPLTALASIPHIRATWGAGRIQIPKSYRPGILILHRQFMNNPKLNEQIETLIRKGWLVVADMDDDPHHWQAYIDSDFFAFRSAHAVTVSTPRLKAMMVEWNPHVQVLPNALLRLPKPNLVKENDLPLRVFFGALNRTDEWRSIFGGIESLASELRDLITFVIVHDKKVHELIPNDFTKEFHPTLSYEDYLALLQTCDLALLPLLDTPFNRLKSDLKLIESCACGAVPLFSPTVYGEKAIHKKIGVEVKQVGGWGEALLGLARNAKQVEAKRAAGFDYVRRQRLQAQAIKIRQKFYEELWHQREFLERDRQSRLKEVVGRVGLEPTTKGL